MYYVFLLFEFLFQLGVTEGFWFGIYRLNFFIFFFIIILFSNVCCMFLFLVYDGIEATWWEAVGTDTCREEARANISALARLLDTYDRNDDSDRDQYHPSASDQAMAPAVPPTSAAAGARDACLDETARVYGQTGNWRMLEAEEMTAAARNPILAQAVGRPLVTH
jgi:hypothetical protein